MKILILSVMVLLVTTTAYAKNRRFNNQIYLFEVESIKATKVFSQKGYYIDYKGNLYSYGYDDAEKWRTRFRSDCRRKLTNACLRDKYNANKKLVKKLGLENVKNKLNLSKFIPASENSGRHAKCNYAKTTHFSTFSYNSRYRSYTKKALIQYNEKDDSKSQYATLIIKWLSKLTGVKVSYFCNT